MSARVGCGTLLGETTTSATPSKNAGGTSEERRRMRVSKSEKRMNDRSPFSPPSGSDAVAEIALQLVERDPVLTHRVTVANRDGPARDRVAVDRDAERGP